MVIAHQINLDSIEWLVHHSIYHRCKLCYPLFEVRSRYPTGDMFEYRHELDPKFSGGLCHAKRTNSTFGETNIFIMYISDVHVVHDLQNNCSVDPVKV